MLSKMIFTACTVGVQMAVAENLLNVLFDEENEFAHLEQGSDFDLPPAEFRRQLRDANQITDPAVRHYFMSKGYLAKDKDVKLQELWD